MKNIPSDIVPSLVKSHAPKLLLAMLIFYGYYTRTRKKLYPDPFYV